MKKKKKSIEINQSLSLFFGHDNYYVTGFIGLATRMSLYNSQYRLTFNPVE